MSELVVFLFLLQAVAGPTAQSYATDATYTVLVFAVAEDRGGAELKAVEAMKEHGWTNVVVSRSGVVRDPEEMNWGQLRESLSKPIEEAYQDALSDGVAIAVFSDSKQLNNTLERTGER